MDFRISFFLDWTLEEYLRREVESVSDTPKSS